MSKRRSACLVAATLLAAAPFSSASAAPPAGVVPAQIKRAQAQQGQQNRQAAQAAARQAALARRAAARAAMVAPVYQTVKPALRPGEARQAAALRQAGAGRHVEGTLAGLFCGQGCRLTINVDRGGSVTGLCRAPQCADWNAARALPMAMLGRHVRATLTGGGEAGGAVTQLQIQR